MNVRQALICTAFFCSAGTLHAQVCSGGAGGGTDSTGNDCIDTTKSLRKSIPNDGEHKGVSPPASRWDRQLQDVQILADNVEVVRSPTLFSGKRQPNALVGETPTN